MMQKTKRSLSMLLVISIALLVGIGINFLWSFIDRQNYPQKFKEEVSTYSEKYDSVVFDWWRIDPFGTHFFSYNFPFLNKRKPINKARPPLGIIKMLVCEIIDGTSIHKRDMRITGIAAILRLFVKYFRPNAPKSAGTT